MYRIAINGYGRIGRNVLRALYESGKHKTMKIVAINDLAEVGLNAHLTKYDSVHGRFPGNVAFDEKCNVLFVNGDKIAVSAIRDPSKLPWKVHDVDLVLECTGLFTTGKLFEAHLAAGAKKVLISAPSEGVKMVVYGVNHKTIQPEDVVISNASCTTNCLAPLAKVINDAIGIEYGLMTTVHAYTNDQNLTDSQHKDWHRARSATQSMIPTSTGAAKSIGLVLPELKGKLDGYAMRVPTINVSVVDLTFEAKKTVSLDEINTLFLEAAKGAMSEVLCYNDKPLVSIDFNHNPYSCTFDATQTKVVGNMYKVLAWYDNEWGFSNRMLDTSLEMLRKS